MIMMTKIFVHLQSANILDSFTRGDRLRWTNGLCLKFCSFDFFIFEHSEQSRLCLKRNKLFVYMSLERKVNLQTVFIHIERTWTEQFLARVSVQTSIMCWKIITEFRKITIPMISIILKGHLHHHSHCHLFDWSEIITPFIRPSFVFCSHHLHRSYSGWNLCEGFWEWYETILDETLSTLLLLIWRILCKKVILVSSLEINIFHLTHYTSCVVCLPQL